MGSGGAPASESSVSWINAWTRVLSNPIGTSETPAGWTPGPQRDDAKREHPCLVPYEALTEADRDADRQTAMAALRALLALGFEIRRP